MPFGYSKYLEDKSKSHETINSYVKEINYFFSFLDFKYSKQKELFEITSRDIKDYLEDKRKKGSKTVTINKHITILKSFFDYLWTINKVPIDPCEKIKRIKEIDIINQKLNYKLLLETLPQVLERQDYSALKKVIYILSLYGIRASEFQIEKENVVIDPINTYVKIKTKKRNIKLTNQYAEYFMEYFYNESMFNLSKYVFITNKHNDTVVPVEAMTIYSNLRIIAEDFSLPGLKLNDIRHAYAYYLYCDKKLTIEQVAEELGIEEQSAALLIEASLQRITGKVS